MLEETDTSGTMQRDYIFFRRIAWRDSSGNVYYYFADAIGSTRAVTDATGTTCFEADYYPYGQENDYVTSCSPTYKFAGYEYDTETGNYYAYARYYSPRLGRFLTADPLGGSVSNPQSLNRYSYVLNDPESLVDPSGMVVCQVDEQTVPCKIIAPLLNMGGVSSVFFGDVETQPPMTDDMVNDLMDCFGSWLPPDFCAEMLGFSGNSGGSGWLRGLPISPPQPQTPCSVSPSSLNAYLKSKNSPLAGQGSNLFNAGRKYNVDPRLIVALAGAETTFGENITWGAFNAWNWGWNTANQTNSPFGSWAAGINAVTRGIGIGPYYFQAGRNTTSSLYSQYCNGAGCAQGLNNLNTFLKQEGGNPNQLQFPCKKEGQ